MRRVLLAPVLILSAVLALRASQSPSRPAESAAPAEAIRLNSRGVASMNQQKFEQGLEWFESHGHRPDACRGAREPGDCAHQPAALRRPAPCSWRSRPPTRRTRAPEYNAGAAPEEHGRGGGVPGRRPRPCAGDAHSHYFVGLMAAQIKKYDDAVRAFAGAGARSLPGIGGVRHRTIVRRAGRAEEAKLASSASSA